MRIRAIAYGTGLLVVAAFAPHAGAFFDHVYQFRRTALDCQPVYGHTTWLDYREEGVINKAGSTAEVFCPAFNGVPEVGSTSYYADSIRVFVNDRSSTVPFYCYAYAIDPAWGADWSPTKYTSISSNNEGHLVADETGYTGTATLLFDVEDAAGGSGATYYRQAAGVRCYIPPGGAAVSTQSGVKEIWTETDVIDGVGQ